MLRVIGVVFDEATGLDPATVFLGKTRVYLGVFVWNFDGKFFSEFVDGLVDRSRVCKFGESE